MPDDFDDVARRAARSVRAEADDADARLGSPTARRTHRAALVVSAAVATAAIVVAGALVVGRNGSGSASHKPVVSASTSSSPVPSTTSSLVPSRPITSFEPGSATFVSPRTGWVVGDSCPAKTCHLALLRTEDSGATWSAVASPPTMFAPAGSAPSGVNSVRFANQNDGYVFGAELWSTHDGGSHWTQVPLDHPSSVALEIAGSKAVAVSLTDHVTLWSSPVDHDDWTASAVAVSIGAGPVPAVQLAAHGSNAWMLLVNRVVSGAARFQNGQWQAWNTPTDKFGAHAVLAASTDRDLMIAGDNSFGSWPSPQSVKVFVSSDGGNTFDAGQTIAAAIEPQVAAAPEPSHLFVGGRGGDSLAMFESSDRGRTWESSSIPASAGPDVSFQQLGFTTSTQGVVIVARPDLNPYSAVMLMTFDGGRDWSQVVFTTK